MSAERHAPRLPAEAVNRLHVLWAEVLRREDAGIPRDELRQAAREIGVAAHRASLLPEQLLPAVKHSWSAHAEFRRPEQRHRVQWVLTEFVSLCIDEYYRAAPSGSATAASPDPSASHQRAQ